MQKTKKEWLDAIRTGETLNDYWSWSRGDAEDSLDIFDAKSKRTHALRQRWLADCQMRRTRESFMDWRAEMDQINANVILQLGDTCRLSPAIICDVHQPIEQREYIDQQDTSVSPDTYRFTDHFPQTAHRFVGLILPEGDGIDGMLYSLPPAMRHPIRDVGYSRAWRITRRGKEFELGLWGDLEGFKIAQTIRNLMLGGRRLLSGTFIAYPPDGDQPFPIQIGRSFLSQCKNQPPAPIASAFPPIERLIANGINPVGF